MKRKSLPTTHPRNPLRIFIFVGFSGSDFWDFRVLTWRPRLRFSRIPPGSLSGLPDRKCFTMPGSQPVPQPASQAVSSQPARQAASQLTIYQSLKQPVSHPLTYLLAKNSANQNARLEVQFEPMMFWRYSGSSTPARHPPSNLQGFSDPTGGAILRVGVRCSLLN